ncbi:MAG: thioredoxin family protein [bacterium]
MNIKIMLLCIIALIAPTFAKASDKPVNVYLFYADGCPHCREEKKFLEKIEQKYKNARIYKFEISENGNSLLFRKTGEALGAETSGVPFTVVGNKYFIGWYNDNTTGLALENEILNAMDKGCMDVVGNLLKLDQPNKNSAACPVSTDDQSIPKKIQTPFFGEIEVKNLSLPVLTAILGVIDGFNPCAMWVLLFLISLLLGMNDKKRMWILGGSFIVASGAVYFLFMSAWLNLFLLLGFILWIRIIVGFVAFISGGYNLREYYINKDGGCKIGEDKKHRKIFEKLKSITHEKSFWFALGGIIILAIAVNLVELICSAGIPAVYTKILTLTNLVKWKYYLYLILYIFFFIIDDLIIFFIAMFTLQMTGISAKYSRISRLAGGIAMILIGLLLIFKPAWLMF